MDEMTAKDAAIAWGWVIEALAGFKEVGVSLLRDLIEMAPDLPHDLENNVKERVALRCLEDLFDGIAGDVPLPSAQHSKVHFDFSERCQDVLQRIMNETPESDLRMGGVELMKWDIEPFIMHKRASMPKCALKQLKESILDGTHPYADFLIGKSGLTSVRGGGTDRVPVGDSNGRPNGSCSNAPNMDANVLPSKRHRMAVDTQKMEAGEHENMDANVSDSDYSRVNAKKMKWDASYVLQSVEHNQIPLPGRELLEDSSESDIPVSESERSDFAEYQMGVLEKSRVLEDGHYENAVHKSRLENPCGDEAKGDSELHAEPRISGVAPPDETQIKVSAKESGGPQQKPIVDEGKDDSEHLPEPTTSGAASPNETQQQVSTKESNCYSEHDSHIKVAPLASAEGSQQKTIADGAEGLMDCHSESSDSDGFCNEKIDVAMKKSGSQQKTIADGAEGLMDCHSESSDSDGFCNEKIDVAMKKHDFLSSQCTLNGDSSATTDWTEQNLCIKCNEGGQLLICNTSDCPLVFHENCLGSEFISYKKGNFYCPFCSYCLALKKYREAKKEASLLKKDLGAFICTGFENQLMEFLD